MRKNKGITLIALIITIVVMLILVAVSINVIVNSNIIGHAEKTGEAYKNTVEKEDKYNPTVGEWKKVDDYMANAGIVEEKHNWQYTDETRGAIKCECEECQEKANSTEGRTLSVGQEIAYQVERENKTGEVGTRYAS